MKTKTVSCGCVDGLDHDEKCGLCDGVGFLTTVEVPEPEDAEAKALVGTFLLQLEDLTIHEVLAVHVDARFTSGWSMSLTTDAYPGITYPVDPRQIGQFYIPAPSYREADAFISAIADQLGTRDGPEEELPF